MMKKFIEVMKGPKGATILGILFAVLMIGGPILTFSIVGVVQRPKYVQGDFSKYYCSADDCSNKAEWRYSKDGMEYYYCAEHQEEGERQYEDAIAYKSHKTTTKTMEDTYGHDRFDAIVIARKIVSDKLQSPSTAKFCGNSDYTVKCSGNAWTVSGYVDAQNGFGAELRSQFTVGFTFSSSDQYTIVSCIIQ